MKLIVTILCFSAVSPAYAQQPRPELADRADVIKLLELVGTRDQVKAQLPQSMEQAKTLMQTAYPNFDPKFVEEWARRMAERLDFDQYFEVFVQAHLKHLSREDVAELLVRAEAQAKGQTLPPPTASLQERLISIQPALLGEITGKTTELGAKLGSEIGGEIEKEHPEWTKAPSVPATH